MNSPKKYKILITEQKALFLDKQLFLNNEAVSVPLTQSSVAELYYLEG